MGFHAVQPNVRRLPERQDILSARAVFGEDLLVQNEIWNIVEGIVFFDDVEERGFLSTTPFREYLGAVSFVIIPQSFHALLKGRRSCLLQTYTKDLLRSDRLAPLEPKLDRLDEIVEH